MKKIKLGIMQPYFFPYIGYFALIKKTDQWVVFDSVQYTKKSWMSRNRILHPNENWQYISVSLKNASRTKIINQIFVKNLDESRKKIIRQIEHYSKVAPYYDIAIDLINKAFKNSKSDSLLNLNISGIKTICKYLKIKFIYKIWSLENKIIPSISHPGEWALEISSALKVQEYINPINGRKLFYKKDFLKRGIKLSFLKSSEISYPCFPYKFIQNLSILDIIMWNNIDQINSFIDSHKIID